MSRRSDPWPGSSGPPSFQGKNSRYPKTSADEHFLWEEETARREKHRRRAKCSKKNGPRYTNNPQDLPPRVASGEHRTLPGCRPAPAYGKFPGALLPECAARERRCRRSSWEGWWGQACTARRVRRRVAAPRYDRKNSPSSAHWRWSLAVL